MVRFMALLILRIIIASLNVLLCIYFGYTILAILKGAAPIPSRRATIKRMLQLSKIKPGERLLDLGSGDGRIVFAAADQGAVCTGIEINPFLSWISSARAKLRSGPRVEIQRGDFWKADLSSVDILTVYLVPKFMDQLKTKVKNEMTPGSRVVVAVYPFPEWVPNEQIENVFLYIVPPPVPAAV